MIIFEHEEIHEPIYKKAWEIFAKKHPDENTSNEQLIFHVLHIVSTCNLCSGDSELDFFWPSNMDIGSKHPALEKHEYKLAHDLENLLHCELKPEACAILHEHVAQLAEKLPATPDDNRLLAAAACADSVFIGRFQVSVVEGVWRFQLSDRAQTILQRYTEAYYSIQNAIEV